MPIFYVRAEEKKTVYGITVFKVEAKTAQIAKLKVENDDESLEVVESWDNATEDIEYTNSKHWDVEKGN
jgi:hypothetical protein